MSEPTPRITSAANPRIRAALRLRDRREREHTGTTIVDGGREIRRAIEAGVVLMALFFDAGRATGADAIEALRLAEQRGPLSVIPVSAAVLDRIAYGDRSDGVVAVVRAPAIRLAQIELSADPFVVIVEGVEKPGNLGAILRSADGAGADAVVVADPITDVFNPNAIRASLGTIFTRPVATATSVQTLEWLRTNGIRIVAAQVDGPVEYTDVALGGPLAIVVGSEADGLSEQWRAADVVAVRLPMLGAADSLNVSNAAAILFYEALRQRRASGDRPSAAR